VQQAIGAEAQQKVAIHLNRRREIRRQQPYHRKRNGFTEEGTTPLVAVARALAGDVPAAVSTAAPLTN
jgi:hypothetical protein